MKTQWQTYQELELIPDSVPNPQKNRLSLTQWFQQNWHTLRYFVNRKDGHRYPAKFLETCLAIDCSKSPTENKIWQKVWQWVSPLVADWDRLPAYPEPQIRQILDRQGQAWWHVYDPITGETAYLETEGEVLIWLEARLYPKS
jgi:hypothetical protein